MAQTFEDLEIWKRSSRRAVNICKSLVQCKNFALRDQIQRSAVSVPSNIAEGKERDSQKEFSRFLKIAKASNAELRTQLYIGKELEIFTSELAKEFIEETKELSKMMQAMVNSIEHRTIKQRS